MDKIKSLLNQIAIISKKNAEILDATGGRFNMFRICGVNHYENTHSAIIAEFLNPKGTHGLKSQLLECFIETLGDGFAVAGFDYKNTMVYTEYSTLEGRMDILIEDERNHKAIIIENKIFAEDQCEQLKRYSRFAEDKYKAGNYQILYLTLWGEEASEQSGDGVDYLTISYKETIIDWLEKCVAIASRHPFVRETIIQYINHLKQLTNQEMDTRNQQEITEVLSKAENLRAAKDIHDNYSATFDAIVEKHFNPMMREFARQKGLEYEYERSEEAYVRFYLTHPHWEKRCMIGFTFERAAGGYFYGFTNSLDIKYRLSDEKRKYLHEQLEAMGIHYRRETDWWPFFSNIPSLTIDNWINDIIESDRFFEECRDKIEMILKALEHIDL
ncbi:hypothetical protein IX308_001744 [Porphyromonas levii]|uniref:PDDEXK-like family protein n=1 Tax=Porphyromonas levii TaxID=28114 RepID=UPI001BA485A1|nr:PD-(D/E)XK nuclease family protein [Porphyromonas levii]MBR8785542.1 hypothetical protein [Porphyromonas levii]